MVSFQILLIINYTVKKSTIYHSPYSKSGTMGFIYPMPRITAFMDVSISERMVVVSGLEVREGKRYGEFADFDLSSITL